MERFIRRQNLLRYCQLLEAVADEDERQRILRLLEEEKQKQRDPGKKDSFFEAAAVLCLIQIKVPSSSARKYEFDLLCLVHPPDHPEPTQKVGSPWCFTTRGPPFVDNLADVGEP